MKGPAEQNRALFFDEGRQFDIPVVINLFGSEKRMALGLGVDQLDDLNHRLAKWLTFAFPQGSAGRSTAGRISLGVLRSIGLKPNLVKKAPAQEVIDTETASLNELPILKCWPGDAGRFITLMQVITRDPVSGIRNVGMYRLQVVDERTLLVHWQRHKGGAEHERAAREGQRNHYPGCHCPWGRSSLYVGGVSPDAAEYR